MKKIIFYIFVSFSISSVNSIEYSAGINDKTGFMGFFSKSWITDKPYGESYITAGGLAIIGSLGYGQKYYFSKLSNVRKFKPGDRVMSIMKYGGYKTEVIVPQENTYFIPDGMDIMEAGGFPVIYGTAFSALINKAKVKKNEICVILGATGGVGMAAVEIAKAYDATVIACGGNDKKLLECLNKGADHVLNYNNNILRKELKKLGIKEVDVVVDMVGGQSSLDLVKSLKWDGRLIIVGFTSGNIPEIPANRLLLKNAKAEGLYWGELAYRKPQEIEKDFKILGQLFKDNKLNPSINKIFDLKDATQALKEIANRKNIGKIVLKC